MSKVSPVTMWQCPVTKKYFPTEAEAKKCESRAKAARTKKANAEKLRKQFIDTETERRNYLINNATKFEDIFKLVKDKSLEFWGIEIESIEVYGIRIDTHTIPHKFSFRLTMKGKALSDATKKYIDKFHKIAGYGPSWRSSYSISDLFDSTWWDMGVGFCGIRTGSGCSGQWGKSAMEMDASIAIADFPLIQQDYELYLKYNKKRKEFEAEGQKYQEMGRRFAQTTEEYIAQKKLVGDARAVLEIESSHLKSIEDRGVSLFKLATADARMNAPIDEMNSVANFQPGELKI